MSSIDLACARATKAAIKYVDFIVSDEQSVEGQGIEPSSVQEHPDL